MAGDTSSRQVLDFHSIGLVLFVCYWDFGLLLCFPVEDYGLPLCFPTELASVAVVRCFSLLCLFRHTDSRKEVQVP